MSRINSMILQLRVLAAAVAIAAAFAGSNCADAIDIRIDFNDALAAPTNSVVPNFVT